MHRHTCADVATLRSSNLVPPWSDVRLWMHVLLQLHILTCVHTTAFC